MMPRATKQQRGRRSLTAGIAILFLGSSVSGVASATFDFVPGEDDRIVTWTVATGNPPVETTRWTPDVPYGPFDAGNSGAWQNSSVSDSTMVATGAASGIGPTMGVGQWGNSAFDVEFLVDHEERVVLSGAATTDWGAGYGWVTLYEDGVSILSFWPPPCPGGYCSDPVSTPFATVVDLVPGVTYRLFARAYYGGYDGSGSYEVTLSEPASAPGPGWPLALVLGGAASAALARRSRARPRAGR